MNVNHGLTDIININSNNIISLKYNFKTDGIISKHSDIIYFKIKGMNNNIDNDLYIFYRALDTGLYPDMNFIFVINNGDNTWSRYDYHIRSNMALS